MTFPKEFGEVFKQVLGGVPVQDGPPYTHTVNASTFYEEREYEDDTEYEDAENADGPPKRAIT